MSSSAIRVEGLGKKYRVGQSLHAYRTMRESIAEAAKAPIKLARSMAAGWRQRHAASSAHNEFWALKDLSFDIKAGEIVGVVGGNGAGKSTLLKILSRVTAPTTGFAEIHGQVGSLLEVGTGFHPELSGRENIYLNGAILGMKQSEIRRKFDQIVEFSEIGQFLDTPVKRYSSGMYMRLAFSVAAHLEPDVLLVDEVLAVGDAAFQNKCLGKLQDVAATSERTVFFVSHNMQAVQSLCTRALHLDKGRLVAAGDTKTVIANYLVRASSSQSVREWEQDAPGNDEIRLLAIAAESGSDRHGVYPSSKEIVISMSFEASVVRRALCVGFDLVTPDGITVLRSYQTDLAEEECPQANPGLNTWQCRIPPGLLNGGQYYVCPKISIHNNYWIVDGGPAIRFELVLDHGLSPFWNSLNGNSRRGLIAPILEWKECRVSQCA